MRILFNDADPAVPETSPGDVDALARLYAYPQTLRDGEGRWLRANMVSTLDGAATGPDGRTGSINNEADRRVFMLLRALADVVVVGAGTARAEGYGRTDPPRGELAALREGRSAAPALVVVSRSGGLPPRLAAPPEDPGSRRGEVLLATCEAAGASALDTARETVGEDNVLVLGTDTVDVRRLVDRLADRGMRRMLCEGGPTLLRDMVAAGVLDELCLTVVPHLLAGQHPRILDGDAVRASLVPRLLLEAEGTMLGRWTIS